MIAGLVFALLGDVLLLKEAYFTYGLGAFLIAHLFFTYAFVGIDGFQTNLAVLGGLLVIALLYFRFLYHRFHFQLREL